MLILDLTSIEKSTIKYSVFQYPDGQQFLKIDDISNDIFNTLNVRIYSRMNNFKDVELIICAVKALKRQHITTISLYVPYFLGARSDRFLRNRD